MMRALSGWGREVAPVGAILAVVVAVTAVWLALDRRPPEWDHANHLERAVRCAGDLARRDLPAILERSSFYPPLVLCAAGLAYRLAPSDVAAAQSVVLCSPPPPSSSSRPCAFSSTSRSRQWSR